MTGLIACSGDSSSTPTPTPIPTPTLAPSPTPTSEPVVVSLQRVFENLSFNQPLGMLQSPSDSSRWYVLEKGGKVYWFDATDNTTATKNLYIDLSSTVVSNGEGGLLGMAFHPDYAVNRSVVLSFTEPAANSMNSVIARYQEAANSLTLDESTRENILTLGQPFSNHNGGNIAFGPNDGYLYIGFGDGGSGNDPDGNGQNLDTLLGAMLRINIDTVPYTIPSDNPFIGSGLPEIYASGLRNPWRWSFDQQTGELWLADVGQSAFEEVDIIEAGGNYGWPCMEGFQTTSNTCNASGSFIDPIIAYARDEGTSVTGGYVYRGNALPSLDGVYIFGDFASGSIWAITQSADNAYERSLLLDTPFSISSFGQSNDGEMFVVSYGDGGIYQLVLGPR